MKKILFLILIAFGMNARAQITLEHTYDSAAMVNYCNGNYSQLMIINFEVSGERYVKINRCGQVINIYDMNHSLLQTISVANVPLSSMGTVGDLLYLSQNLFALDNAIEFMYSVTLSGGSLYTGIYNENGTLIFSDTGAALIHANYEQQQLPIYNTSVGSKLILSYRNKQAKVFSLPGTLTTAINEANNNLIAAQSQSSVSNPYPNPTGTTTQIDYRLPDGVNEGEIIFYDLVGNEVKRFKVDKTFSTLLVSTADIEAGTYLYQLQTTAQSSEGKKMVVIK